MVAETLKGKATYVISTPNPAVEMCFDIDQLDLDDKLRKVVHKLFSQNPTAEVAVDEHSHTRERGKEGPASRYLTREEFESVRTLGVRLGTSGVLAATACDFCLHCVKLEARPELGRSLQR